MKLAEIMKKKISKNLDLILNSNMRVREIKKEDIESCLQDNIGIVDDKGKIIGEINKEQLEFIKTNYDNWDAIRILDNIEEGVVALDNTGRIFYANKTYSIILGVPISKVLGKFIQEIEADASIINVLKTGKPLFKNNQRIKSVNKYVSVKIYPFYEEDVLKGAYSIFNDITEIQHLNKEVKRISNVVDEVSRQNKAHQALKELNVIGKDKYYLDLISKAIVVAPTNVTVLIRGDNGVGKEIFAKLIHKNSLRKDKPLISVNCAAIPENLIESEFFGYEEGAFTGASKDGKVGKFVLADGGTLFLDEIGDMPVNLQSKLLRALQEGEIEPLGGKTSVKVDVRVIAATNQPLEKMIEQKLFREDLYYRLNAITFYVPRLHDRGHDVILLANFFLNKFNEEYGKDLVLSREVYDLFLVYHWPGNVRELINCLKFSVILCNRNMIMVADLPASIRNFNLKDVEDTSNKTVLGEVPKINLRERLKEYEKQIILDTIEICDGDKEKTIEVLGISRRTLFRKLKEINSQQ